MGFDASELLALSADLGDAPEKVIQEARKALHATAWRVKRSAQQLAPVDTGFLRGSITTSAGAGGLSSEIGPTAEYGAYVEFGTRRMAAQPYMLPALTANAEAFEQAITEIAGDFL